MKDTNLAKVINKSAMAKEIGLAPATVIRIFNQKQTCSKLVAYCITKFIDSTKEISDMFIKLDLKGE